jgi:TRAP-type C4-dicarboxylate transport system permease small subunit
MKIIKIAGVLFIAAGILGLVYGGFDYTKSTHEAKLGPIEFAIKKQEHINVPMWAGVSAIVLGGVLLLLPAGTKKR